MAGEVLNQPKYSTMKNLTRRQNDVLNIIEEMTKEKGYPPSMREITARMNLSSAAGIHKHIKALQKKGFLTKEDFLSRSLKIVRPAAEQIPPPEMVELPLVGFVAAGLPIEEITQSIETLTIPSSLLNKPSDRYFLLQVRGDSMIDESILDGDFVIIEKRETAENGEVVIALLDGRETTLKRFFREPTRIRLQPANALMSPIYIEDTMIQIQGIVAGLWRRY